MSNTRKKQVIFFAQFITGDGSTSDRRQLTETTEQKKLEDFHQWLEAAREDVKKTFNVKSAVIVNCKIIE